MVYTQSTGNVTELLCIAKFIEMGYEVSIPYGNGAKYDFIADVNGELLKIQCKTASMVYKNGVYDADAFQFSCICTTTNTKGTVRHSYNNEQVDYFATCWKDKVYLIPVDECSTSKTLRLTPPLNKGVTYNKAQDYEIEKRISFNEELVLSKKDFLERKENKIIKEFFCSNCGKKLYGQTKTNLCQECCKKSSRTVERPTREELKKMIREQSFISIGSHYNVTDNTIRKWCDAENLPRKKTEIQKYTEEEWKNI